MKLPSSAHRRRAIGLALHFAAALLVGLSCNPADRHAERSNILLILTEDQGAHLGAMGTPGLATPHMDSLAREGVRFDQAFVAYPVCSASKAAIYTGLYAHGNGLLGNARNVFKPAKEMSEGERAERFAGEPRIEERVPTLIEILNLAGYYTGVTFKLHVQPNHKFPYDEFIDAGRRPGDTGPAVTAFIANAAKRDAPFFLMLNTSPPHRPFPAGAAHPVDLDAVEPPAFLPDTPLVRRDWAEYLSAIALADVLVGEALDALRASGRLERTLIILTGDHGPAFQRGKMSPYDLGLRVPLVIRGPGVVGNRVTELLASHVDLMPTILDWAGETTPRRQHGHSLRPILEGGTAPVRDFAFATLSHPSTGRGFGMEERSIHDGRHHLIYRENTDEPRLVNADLKDWKVWRNRTWAETLRMRRQQPRAYEILAEIEPQTYGRQPPAIELYDLATDPDELENLAEQREYEPVRRSLLVALERWARETVDPRTRLASSER